MKVTITVIMAMLLVVEVEAVRLRWDAPLIGEPVGYTVYRYAVVNGRCSDPVPTEFELIGSAATGAQPEFVDDSPVKGANHYYVTAYNSEGESLPSNQVCFQRQGEKTSPPLNLRVE